MGVRVVVPCVVRMRMIVLVRARRAVWPGQVTSKLRPTKAPRLRRPKATRSPRTPIASIAPLTTAAGTPASTSAATAMSPAIPEVGSKCRCRPRRAHVAGVRFRLSIDAIRPAPNPLSMFTTATPAAQEFSIPSSAATPPKLAPYPTLVGTAMTGRA